MLNDVHLSVAPSVDRLPGGSHFRVLSSPQSCKGRIRAIATKAEQRDFRLKPAVTGTAYCMRVPGWCPLSQACWITFEIGNTYKYFVIKYMCIIRRRSFFECHRNVSCPTHWPPHCAALMPTHFHTPRVFRLSRHVNSLARILLLTERKLLSYPGLGGWSNGLTLMIPTGS